MIILTIHKGGAGRKERREFAGIREAIDFGQRTGADYEIYDPATGRVIDWNEINVKEEPEWYYDEREALWKRHHCADDAEETGARGILLAGHFTQSRNLRRAGS